MLTGCSGNRQSDDGLITIDVTKSYPMKELILQEFMDVEYIPLETNDEFLCQGLVQAIGKNVILLKNRSLNDGDIFLYDRNGKALRKINHRGQGPEEYVYILKIALDEDNNEMFVNCPVSRKVQVYDLYGKFKRSLKYKEGDRSLFYSDIFNFDRDNLICYEQFNEDIAFVLISKQDGSITKEIIIPFKEKKEARIVNSTASVSHNPYGIIPYQDSWILTELSSDTIFSYSHDHNMKPFIRRTPSIQSMNLEVFLMGILTDRYYFMETVKKIYDFVAQTGFPSTELMYDKQEQAFFEYNVYNSDYFNNKQVNMISRPVNDEIATYQILEAYQLVEDYEKGLLKGRLKEIAAELDAEDNPVIMIAKHKK